MNVYLLELGPQGNLMTILGGVDLVVAVTVLFLPWNRWPPRASLWILLPPTLALIQLFASVQAHTAGPYSVFFLLVFMWVGISHPPGSSFIAAPLVTLAYLVPVVTHAQVGSVARSVGVVIPIGIAVGELIARAQRAAKESLAETNEQLKAANRELEAFSYGVAHDLRAPLRTIRGFSEDLLENYASEIPEEAVSNLQRVQRGVERMQLMIDDILNLSRSTKRELRPRPVRVRELVDKALDELSPQLASHPVEVRVDDLPDCVADATLLQAVFTNLLSNAIKFTGKTDEAQIEIGCEVGDENVYVVRDNGAGFDMAYVEKLFGLFQRLHNNSEFEGTGIGLALCKGIISRHGGRIWAEAEPGRGATFRFTLGTGSLLPSGA